jgi:hypothetical protein
VAAASATDDALALLGGVPLAYGRTTEARRDHGADGFVNGVVISRELWRRRYNASTISMLRSSLAYLTAQRTQEFGVRMALGASAPQILGSVAREGVTLSALGAAADLAGAAVLSTWLRDLLYEVGPFDGPTLIGVTGLVAIVAVVSAISPAWRAARVDPVAALRAE